MKKAKHLLVISSLVLMFAAVFTVCISAANAGSGYCMNTSGAETNIKWQMTSDGILSFEIDASATDKVATTEIYNKDPVTGTATAWNAACPTYADAVKIIFGDGITAINGFACLQSLTSVIIPESLTVINGPGFECASILQSITLSGNTEVVGTADLSKITKLGAYSFDNCKKISNVILSPDYAGVLDTEVFKMMPITELEIPEGVTLLKNKSLRGTQNLKTVTVLGMDTEFESLDVFMDNSSYPTIIAHVGSEAEAFANENGLTFVDIDNIHTVVASGSDKDTYHAIDWTLTSDGTLTITSQEGHTGWNEVPHRKNANSSVYYPFADQVKKIVIGEGLSKVGSSTFSDFENLEEVEWSSITHISKNAFNNCPRLKTIYITGNTPEIGKFDLGGTFKEFDSGSENNFLKCGMTSVSFDKVKTVPAKAFVDCYALTNVTFGADIETIDENAFVNCTNLSVIFGTKGTAAEAFANEHGYTFAEVGTDVDIPEAVTTVTGKVDMTDTANDLTWEFDLLTNVLTIKGTSKTLTMNPAPSWEDEKQKNIPWYDYVDSISKVVIEAPVTEINAWFAFSRLSNCKTIVLPDTNIVLSGSCAFAYAHNLETFGPEGTPKGTVDLRKIISWSWSYQPFEDCFHNKTIRVLMPEEGVPGETFDNEFGSDSTTINFIVAKGSESETAALAFAERTGEKRYPDVVNIYYYGEEPVFGSYSDEYTGINWCFTQDGTLTITKISGLSGAAYAWNQIPYRSTLNDGHYYPYANDVKKIIIGSGINCIGGSAFADFINLEEVEWNGGYMKEIKSKAFDNCPKLKTIYYSGTSPEEGTLMLGGAMSKFDEGGGTSYFGSTAMTKIEFGSMLKNIPAMAFVDCPELTTVYFGKYTESIDAGAFVNCPKLNTVYGLKGSAAEAFASEQGYTFIEAEYTNEDDFSISGNATGIFASYLGNDSEVIFPALVDGVAIDGLASQAINRNQNVKNVVISEGIRILSSYCFYVSNNVETVTIPSTVTNITGDSFYECLGIKEFIVSEDNQSFCSVDGDILTKDKTCIVKIASTKSGDYVVPDYVNDIMPKAFRACPYITTITMHDHMTGPHISDESSNGCQFVNLDSLTAINIADNQHGYYDIDGVYFMYNGTLLRKYPDNKPDKVYTVPDGVNIISDYAFYRANHVERVILPESVTTLYPYSFSGCEKLNEIVIPKSLKNIQNYTFNGINSILTVYYAGTEEEWNKISIGASGNEGLLNSNIIYNYVPEPEPTCVLELNDIEANIGKNVEVALSIKNNPGIAGASLALEFDKNILTPVAVMPTGSFSNANLTSNLQEPGVDKESLDRVTAVIYNPSDMTGDGEFVKFIFKVRDDAPEGNTSIYARVEDFSNAADKVVKVSDASGVISIKSAVMPGDIDGSEKIDITDLVKLAQFLANWNVTIVNEAADCDGNGNVNISDLVRLAQYLANWKVELGK